jgi:hypothetical protein
MFQNPPKSYTFRSGMRLLLQLKTLQSENLKTFDSIAAPPIFKRQLAGTLDL